jgi:hypothetical protein
MEEELALHDEEGEVVERPASGEEAAESVIEDNGGCAWRGHAFTCASADGRTIVKVLVASLGPQDEEDAYAGVGEDGEGAEVPDEWVTDQVDLSVVLDPEAVHSWSNGMINRELQRCALDASAQQRPRLRSGVVCVAIGEAGVGPPHDGLELPELFEEARLAVVDLFGARVDCAADVRTTAR